MAATKGIVLLEVHHGGTMDPAHGATMMERTNVYVGGRSTLLALRKAEVEIGYVVQYLCTLTDHNPKTKIYYMQRPAIGGQWAMSPLETKEDEVALGCLAESVDVIKVFLVTSGIKESLFS